MLSDAKRDEGSKSNAVAGRGCVNSMSLLEMKPGGEFEVRTSRWPGARVHSRQRGMPRAISFSRFLRSLLALSRALRSFSSSAFSKPSREEQGLSRCNRSVQGWERVEDGGTRGAHIASVAPATPSHAVPGFSS